MSAQIHKYRDLEDDDRQNCWETKQCKGLTVVLAIVAIVVVVTLLFKPELISSLKQSSNSTSSNSSNNSPNTYNIDSNSNSGSNLCCSAYSKAQISSIITRQLTFGCNMNCAQKQCAGQEAFDAGYGAKIQYPMITSSVTLSKSINACDGSMSKIVDGVAQ